MGGFELCLVSERLIQRYTVIANLLLDGLVYCSTVGYWFLIVLKFLNDSTDLPSLVLQIQRLSRTPLVRKQVWHFKGFLGCPSSKISICDSFPGRFILQALFIRERKKLWYFFSNIKQVTFGNKLLGQRNYLLSQLFHGKAKKFAHTHSSSSFHPPRPRHIPSGKIHPQGFPELVWCRSNLMTLVSSKAQGWY